MPTHPSHNDLGDDPDGTTRTRLPESDTAAARRPPRSSPRALVTVVGVVVLLIAALAFATRGSGGSGQGSGTAAPGPNGTAAAPTAPTGAQPVTGKTAGIASGFPQSPEGAQSAAANYAVALGGDGMFKVDSRHRIVSAIYDPSVAGAMQSKLDSAYSPSLLSAVGLQPNGSAPAGFTFVSRTAPIGTKVTAGSADSATVQVWCVGLTGLAGTGSTKPVTENWFTVTESLRWVQNDWKVESSTQQQGPAPVGGDNQASSADQIVSAVNGYGGFTYAR